MRNDLPEAAQIHTLVSQLTSIERQLMKSMLSGKVSDFFDRNNRLRPCTEQETGEFFQLADLLRRLTPASEQIPSDGIAYRGFCELIDSDLLAALQREALQRRHEPLDRTDHYLGCGGPLADRLSVLPQLTAFVASHVGPVAASGIASYLYYDAAGLGIRPHIDTEVFSINLMLMLQHDCPTDVEPSATVVFPAYEAPQSHRLRIGEMMIMYGSSVIHTRSPVRPGENIHLLTLGFKRLLPT